MGAESVHHSRFWNPHDVDILDEGIPLHLFFIQVPLFFMQVRPKGFR